jgi:hypothetical protein
MSKPKNDKPAFDNPVIRQAFKNLVNQAVHHQCKVWNTIGEIEGLFGKDINNLDELVVDLAAAIDDGLTDDSQTQLFFNRLKFTED